MMENNLFERTRKKKRKPGQRTKEEQAVINQAKEVLMDKNNMSENEAHSTYKISHGQWKNYG